MSKIKNWDDFCEKCNASIKENAKRTMQKRMIIGVDIPDCPSRVQKVPCANKGLWIIATDAVMTNMCPHCAYFGDNHQCAQCLAGKMFKI